MNNNDIFKIKTEIMINRSLYNKNIVSEELFLSANEILLKKLESEGRKNDFSRDIPIN